MLEFKQSFFGREDISLRNKLEVELPGIANRCLAAYRRLCARGRFIQPRAGLDLAQKIEAKGNAYAAFMSDCFVDDLGGPGVLCGAFFLTFQGWCRETRRFDLLTETPQTLIKNVNCVERWQHLKSQRAPRDDGPKRPRRYYGIRQRES
jgi:phage/plasmid-associated DNA primase